MRRIYTIIIVFEIFALLFLVVLNSRKDQEQEEPVQQQQEVLPSIFSVLPYESEGFSVYYFSESDTFSVQINDVPYEQNLEDAFFFLHKYDETRDFTKEDIRIVKPSYMY